MTFSGDPELEKITAELDCLSLKGQQLNIRKQILSKYQELRKNREESGKSEEGASYQHELDSIDAGLRQLFDRNTALQKRKENILSVKQHKKEDDSTDSARAAPAGSPVPQLVVIVDPPPSFHAPSVILDLEKLSTHPGNTQCPHCQQFITTELCGRLLPHSILHQDVQNVHAQMSKVSDFASKRESAVTGKQQARNRKHQHIYE